MCNSYMKYVKIDVLVFVISNAIYAFWSIHTFRIIMSQSTVRILDVIGT